MGDYSQRMAIKAAVDALKPDPRIAAAKEERARVLAIIAAEKEWGGGLEDVEERVKSGGPARHIEGWSK